MGIATAEAVRPHCSSHGSCVLGCEQAVWPPSSLAPEQAVWSRDSEQPADLDDSTWLAAACGPTW